MNLNKQIKKYRELHGISQEELAEKLYVSRQTISNWETKKNYPDIHNLLLLSTYFNITLDELVKGDIALIKNELDKYRYKKLHLQKNSMLLLSIFIMIIGRKIFGDLFSIIIGCLIIIIVLLFNHFTKKIEFKHNIITPIFSYRSLDEIIFYFEHPNSTQEDYLISNKKNKNKNLLFYFIAIGLFLLFIILSSIISNKIS